MNLHSMMTIAASSLFLSLAPAASAADRGVTDSEIVVGASQPLTGAGASSKTGSNVVIGVEAFFQKLNREGGINGRKVRYIVRDSENEVPKALEMTHRLFEDDGIFAVVGPMGTPAMVAIRPYVTKIGLPVIGPIDGDNRYRFPPNPEIFYLRASFEQEASATLELIKKLYSTSDFALFRPASALGESMKLQYLKAAHEKGMKMVALGVEGEKNGDEAAALKTIADAHPQVIVLSGNPVSNSNFLKAALEKGISANWIVNSAGFSPDFYNGIGRKPPSVIMSSGFPNDASGYPIIKEYEAEMKKENHEVEPYSLEGYLSAAIFTEGARHAGQDLTREKLISSLNSLDKFSLGGIQLTYRANDHAGLKEVFFFKITKDGFSPLTSVVAAQ